MTTTTTAVTVHLSWEDVQKAVEIYAIKQTEPNELAGTKFDKVVFIQTNPGVRVEATFKSVLPQKPKPPPDPNTTCGGEDCRRLYCECKT